MRKWSKSFGLSVSLQLQKRGWTNSRLSEESGISAQMIGKYLEGKAEPSLSAAGDIAHALGVPLSVLIGETKGIVGRPKIAQILDMLERALLLKASISDPDTIHKALAKSPYSTDIPLDSY